VAGIVIAVLLADSSERIVSNLARRLAGEEDIAVCGSAADGERAVQETLRLQPDIAVVDAALPGMDGVQTTEMLAQYAPKTGVILMSMESESGVYRKAMLAGAREVLQKPFKGDDLVAAIRRVHDFQVRKVAATQAAAAAAHPPAAASTDAGEPPPTGRMITVVAGKGGVGKSVVATNLAVLVARVHPGRVVLVDLSLQFGDVAAMLNVTAERSIADLAAHDAVADREVIQQVLCDGPEGLKVLPAPSSPELADYVTTGHLRALLAELRRSFDFVIADATSQLSETTLEAVESSDRVLLVTDFSVTSVKNSRQLLSVAGVLRVDPARIMVVANHRDAPEEGQLDKSRIAAFLGIPLTVEIPHDPAAVGSAVDRGTPVVVSNPRSPVVAALEHLAELVTSDAPYAIGVASTGGAARRRLRRFPGV
jgi:pilus assembly protein CpaE